MRVGVYFCRCGGIISDRIDAEEVRRALEATGAIAYFRTVDLACGEDGIAEITSDLRANRPDAVVVAACSPRDHEDTFRRVLAGAGLNPFMMQLVNIREHVAWVTESPRAATDKAVRQIRAAVARVSLHEPLVVREIDVNTDALVIGAGPAGLKAALTLAEAGRKVVLVERGPILGGMPVRYEDVFPKMECGPCVLEPFIAEALHGPIAENIEILLLSEVVGVVGSFGNFVVRIRKSPRFVDLGTCIGCTACVPACPASLDNDVNCRLNQRKAIDFAFLGGLPNAPYLDPRACLRFRGEECDACRAACLVDGAIDFEDSEQVLERTVGAILVAVGGDLYDCGNLPTLGYGTLPDVVTSLEFERLLSSNGPTGGLVQLSDGRTPESVAIIHCVGSLDPKHKDYCSGICCLTAFKFNALLAHKFPQASVTHYYKTLVAPGKEEADLYRLATGRPQTSLVPFTDLERLVVVPGAAGRKAVLLDGTRREHDLVVLMPALVPSGAAAGLAALLDVGLDGRGFFEERHGRVDATRSKVRGVYIAGTCQAPMDLGRAMTQGASAAGLMLSALVPGRKLQLEAIHAVVDGDRCSGCQSCVGACPYKAISFDAAKKAAEVNPVLCVGCGTCVAACPSGTSIGNHWTNEQNFAEIEGALA